MVYSKGKPAINYCDQEHFSYPNIPMWMFFDGLHNLADQGGELTQFADLCWEGGGQKSYFYRLHLWKLYFMFCISEKNALLPQKKSKILTLLLSHI